jgi:hypothetical protein
VFRLFSHTRLWIYCYAALLLISSGRAQSSTGGNSITAERLEESLGQYFATDPNTASAGLKFVGAARVGPTIGLPADDSAPVFALLDRLANPAIRAPLTIETVGSIYEYILRFREMPQFRYSAEDRKALKRVNKILFKRRYLVCRLFDWVTGENHRPREPSTAYTRYFEFAEKVAEAKDKYNAARGHEDPSIVAKYKEELDHLEGEWLTAGRKKQIEQAMSQYQELAAKPPQTIWSRLEANYSASLQTVGTGRLPKTLLNPQVTKWSDAAGWERVNIPTHNGGSASVRIKRIQVLRPWMDERVFGELSWSWIRSAPLGQNHIVSDGRGLATMMTESKTIGLMPRQLVIATYAADSKGWPQSGFVAGYLASIVPATPKH